MCISQRSGCSTRALFLSRDLHTSCLYALILYVASRYSAGSLLSGPHLSPETDWYCIAGAVNLSNHPMEPINLNKHIATMFQVTVPHTWSSIVIVHFTGDSFCIAYFWYTHLGIISQESDMMLSTTLDLYLAKNKALLVVGKSSLDIGAVLLSAHENNE